MRDLSALVKRHILRYLRDKAAVFFSFLSVIILLTLYILFIGKQYTTYDGLTPLPDGELKTYLVVGVMMGGVLVINSMSLSLGMMGNLIEDLDKHSLDAFLVTPIKRSKIIISYYLAANIVTSTLSTVMWLLTVVYARISGGTWYSLDIILLTILILIFFTFISSSIMIYITTLLKSVNAFGVLSGILGTLVGFVSGIYMPLVFLGDTVKMIASLVPFTHMTILLKNILLEKPIAELANLVQNDDIMKTIETSYGLDQIGVLGINIPMFWIFVGIILFSIGLLYLAFRSMTKKMNR
jgi:multidrug/hemolysin transport system permease protein